MEEEAPTSSSFNPAGSPLLMLLLMSAAISQVKLAVPCPDQEQPSLAVLLLMSRTVRLRLAPETSPVPGRVQLNRSEKVGIVQSVNHASVEEAMRGTRRSHLKIIVTVQGSVVNSH